MSKNQITLIAKQDDYLTVQFKNNWFQEDVESLANLLFKRLTPIEIQENILGADRENIRFSWSDHYFILNFDCYSQSCWFEGQDQASTNHLAALYSTING